MPQGNLETLVSACSGGSCDNKIVCETLATTEATEPEEKYVEDSSSTDFPPESFWLSKDAEFDWFDRNAFYERKDSHKGNSASSNSTNLNHNSNSDLNSQQPHQRFLVKKSKASSIIGLPKPVKPQPSCFIEIKNRTKPGNTRLLFPKRFGSVKSDPTLVEPTSPKVSCMGRVRSRRDRNRNHMKSDKVEKVLKENTRRTRSGCFPSFCDVFRSHGKAREPCILPVAPSPPRNSDIRSRLPPDDREAMSMETTEITETEPVVEPVCLGGMKRFKSGRRSEPLI